MANNAFYGENSDVSAILFDLDNTLIQTRKGDTRACNKVRKSHPQKKILDIATVMDFRRTHGTSMYVVIRNGASESARVYQSVP